MKTESIAHDLFVRITAADGKTRVQAARVWDGALFMESMKSQGEKAKEPADRFTVAMITADEYRNEMASA